MKMRNDIAASTEDSRGLRLYLVDGRERLAGLDPDRVVALLLGAHFPEHLATFGAGGNGLLLAPAGQLHALGQVDAYFLILLGVIHIGRHGERLSRRDDGGGTDRQQVADVQKDQKVSIDLPEGMEL